VPARDKEQPVVAFEQESAGVGQPAVLLKRENPDCGEEDWFDHEAPVK
jgi:hypothetical protein